MEAEELREAEELLGSTIHNPKATGEATHEDEKSETAEKVKDRGMEPEAEADVEGIVLQLVELEEAHKADELEEVEVTLAVDTR